MQPYIKKRQYEANKNICILYHRHTMLIYLIYKDSLIREEKKNQCFWTKDQNNDQLVHKKNTNGSKMLKIIYV